MRRSTGAATECFLHNWLMPANSALELAHARRGDAQARADVAYSAKADV